MPNPNIVSITDFSTGIVQYGTLNYPVAYSTQAPLGSASFAARCINRPGIGLVPFYGSTQIVSGSAPPAPSPAGNRWLQYLGTGMGTLGGVGNYAAFGTGGFDPSYLGTFTQLFEYTDYIVISYTAEDVSGDLWSYGQRYYFNVNSTTSLLHAQLWQSGGLQYPVGMSFDVTSINVDSDFPEARLIIGGLIGRTTEGAMAVPGYSFGDISELASLGAYGFGVSTAVFAHSNRCYGLTDSADPSFVTAPSYQIAQDSFFAYTDPPSQAAASPITPVEVYPSISYTLENTSGFGAWGSISTGELILIRKGNGAVVVSGDAAFPTSVTKLPAVQGTGNIMQRMSMCSQGAVYVTESNGVWVWNGGNVSTKISAQIPDNAVVRTACQPGGFNPLGTMGCNCHHDVQNNLVFFPNNYVFDANTNSWWMCEDPGVTLFTSFSSSKSTTNFMYGMDNAPSVAGFGVYLFDARVGATSWEWTSNPIATPPGALPTLVSVEIVASNPFPTAATITITPTVPPGAVSQYGNNPQPITFNIPAYASGWRGSEQLGYTENNLCIKIVASGVVVGGMAEAVAPALHEIHLEFAPILTTGTGQ